MALISMEQFDRSLDLLPPAMRGRAAALRALAFGRQLDVAEALALAFDAAYAGDEAAAGQMVARAELLAAAARPGASGPPGQPAGSTAAWVVEKGLRGRVAASARDGPCLIATDASFKQGYAGWGYVASSGNWGLSGGSFGGRFDPTGPSAAAVNELRAVHMALSDLQDAGTAVVLADSEAALRYLAEWRAGRVTSMPPGYNLRPRSGIRRSSSTPTLVQLARLVRQRRGLTFQHVPGHRGNTLNEAADALAVLARRCASGEQQGDEATLTARAAALATSFLRAMPPGHLG